MGREWYNGGGRSICSSKSEKKSNEAYGCITALYHFFHFHQSYFSSRHNHKKTSIDYSSRYVTGLVAPRNSLEITEEFPLSTNYKESKSLNIPVGRRTTSKLRDLLVDTSSYIYNSPHTKKPNVVARLMGLDLLPDNLDLNRSSMINERRQRLSENGSGTRSLPESPWIFSPRKSDSEIRRLSLQLNRDIKQEELGCSRRNESKQDEERQSTRHNGRKTVKQIKERVITRRAGMDISNLVEVRKAASIQNQIEQRKVSSQKQNTSSSKPTSVFRQNQISQEPKLLSSSPIKMTLSKDNLRGVNEQPLKPINESKKAHSESNPSSYPTILNNQNKQRRAFIDTSTHSKPDPLEKKKSKKVSDSNDVFNISVASSSFSVTERPRKQVKRAEEPATISSGQIYRYEEKLPQEPRSFNLDDSTTIYGVFSSQRNADIDLENLLVMKEIEEEEKERIVAEIERRIVDALVLETVKHNCLLSG